MKLQIVPNAGRILLHSLSMHLTYWGIAILLAATIAAFRYGIHLIDPAAMLYFSLALLILTPIGRVVGQGLGDGSAQPRIWRSVLQSGMAAAVILVFCTAVARADEPVLLAMSAMPQGPPEISQEITWAATAPHAVPMVARWEGLRTTAYLDTIAEPDVWTVCYGETDNVVPHETRTVAECEEGLATGLHRYWRGWMTAVTEETAMTRLTPERSAAFASLSWNIGIAGARGSTATRRLNAGDIRGACDAISYWNRSGGIIVRGLVNRRSYEREFCLRGLS